MEKKQLFIRIQDTIETEDIEENPQLEECFYSSCRDIRVYLESKTFNLHEQSYNITLIGYMKQIEEYIDKFATKERITIIQGTLMNNEEEIQYINEIKAKRKSIIESIKKQEFDERSTEVKKKQIQEIINNINTCIKDNKNDDIRRYTEELKKYNGLQLYSSNEDNTWLWEYIKIGEELINNTESHTFISTNEEDVTTKMYKCPHCDIHCNDIHNLQNHIVFNHKAKLRYDISFIMQYAMMMKDEKITSMEPRTGYKCAYCSFISTNTECTLRHCIIAHKNRKAKLIEGTIGEQEKVRRYIQEKEENEMREQEEREEQENNQREAFLNTPLQTKIENIDNITKEIFGSKDTNKIHEAQEKLIPYTNILTEATQEIIYLIINGYEGKYIRKQAIIENGKVPQTEEAQYAESIAKLFAVNNEDYTFIHHGEKQFLKSTYMINCPYCEMSCNDAKWMKSHIKNTHQRNELLHAIGYPWQYAISSEKHAKENKDTYFKARECYRCSNCGFQHTDRKEVVIHIRQMHKSGKKENEPHVQNGIAGFKAEADALYETLFHVPLFEPQHISPMNPEIYIFTRNRISTGIQTEVINQEPKTNRTDVAVQVVVRKGGAGGTNQSHGVRDNDRLPSTRTEVNIAFSNPKLRIRRNLKSSLIGCENNSNACYMNSLIQALFNVKSFKDKILQYGTIGNTIITTLRTIFISLDVTQMKRDAWYIDLSETDIFSRLNLNPNTQEDPREVLTYLIDKINQVNRSNAISKLFDFKEVKIVYNSGSEISTINNVLELHPMHDIYSEFENQDIEVLITRQLDKYQRENDVLVTETHLTIPCKVLCINIERTTSTQTQDMFKLNLKKTLKIKDNTYDLKSIIVHHSTDVNSGHFTTYILKGNKTYHINDIKAYEVDIRVNSNYVTCDNISEDCKTAMVIYERSNNIPDIPLLDHPDSGNPRYQRREIPITSISQLINNHQQQEVSNQTNQTQENTNQNTLQEETTIEHDEQQEQNAEENAAENTTQNVQTSTLTNQAHEERNEVYDKLEEQIPIFYPSEEDMTQIKILNNEVKQELSEAHTPEEFMQKITQFKTTCPKYNSMPNLHIGLQFQDINIITAAILKGTLPNTKEEKICGYPNCPKLLKNGGSRTSHWKKIHKLNKCMPYIAFEEIFEILGIDIETKVTREENVEYIKYPLFKCPFNGCDFAVHRVEKLTSHLSQVHKEAYNSVLALPNIYKMLWLMQCNNKPLTYRNMIYEGKAVQCKECGWCTTNKGGAGNHVSTIHREELKEKQIPMQKVNISYNIYERKGYHLSPFMGATMENSDHYRVGDKEQNNIQCTTNQETSTQQQVQQTPISLNNNTISTSTGQNEIEEQQQPQQDIQEPENNNEQNHNISEDMIPQQEEHQDQQEEVRSNNTKENNIEEEDDEEDNILSDEAIQKGIHWHEKYYNMQESIPKFKQERRKALTEGMKSAIKDQIMPILYALEKKNIPDGVPKENVVNGCLCYCFHILTDNAKYALGIIKSKDNKGNSYKPKNTYEEELQNKKRARDAGSKIAKNITIIKQLRQDNLDAGVLQNRVDPIMNDILEEANKLPEDMQNAIFSTNDITKEIVIDTINDIIDQNDETNIISYIENADNDIKEMEEAHKRIIKKKTQELFRLSPSRAMKYYVDPHVSPNCPIPIERIRDELAARWQAEDIGESQATDDWPITYKLSEEDRKYIMDNMQKPDIFKEVIRTRDITSAHGTDGIGYWALKLVPELGSEMMASISKIIIKYGFMPTTWNVSRTILLYKKGDENDLKNWRPLTIASCLYRTWTCALASCLQMINMRGTKLFDDNQKGFIKNKDGCLEHSNMITEAICDANRNRRDIYIASLDLRDAFGSVPHEYIKYVLHEMEFPEEITKLIAHSYDNGTARVRVGSKESDIIHIHKGVKQGCPLSPLIFNFCMNPLLNKVEQDGAGYYISDKCSLKIQAYADDIIIFAGTRDGLQRNLNIVNSFLNYAKVMVNTNKCHTMSYVYRNKRRYYEEEPFQIAGENIPVSDLSQSVEYLGTDATTTSRIRKHGAMQAVNDTKRLIKKIGASMLSLNQKIYAIKTFAIPQLDYVLTNKRINLKEADKIDRLIRTTINKHVKNIKIPINTFYTHWKDGGFSILKLRERALCLRAKTFMALYNTNSTKVREAMRIFTESEREYRRIGTINTNEESKFFNWKIEEKMKKGTDTITIHALRSALKLDLKVELDPETDDIAIITKPIEKTMPQIPEEIIGEPTDALVKITTPKELLIHVTKSTRAKYREQLISNMGIGHSFIDIKDSAYANKFIGDYTHPLNDNIASWIIKARCNLLITGALALKIKGMTTNTPRCPYCGTLGDDTLAHRLNGCKNNKAEQTKRHNNLQNIILGYMIERLGKNLNYRTNKTLNIDGKQVKESLRKLKPDIVTWDKNRIILVEFSCPYANVGRDGNTLDNVYNQKNQKYKELVEECKKVYKRKVSIYPIIVSSLGAIHKKSIEDIKKLLHIAPKETKLINTILRRLSLTACIGSYFIYNKLKFHEYIPDVKEISNEVEVRDDIGTTEIIEQGQSLQQQHQERQHGNEVEHETNQTQHTEEEGDEEEDINAEDNDVEIVDVSDDDDEIIINVGTSDSEDESDDHIADAGQNIAEDADESGGTVEGTQLQGDGNTDGSGNKEEEDRTSVDTANQNIQEET